MSIWYMPGTMLVLRTHRSAHFDSVQGSSGMMVSALGSQGILYEQNCILVFFCFVLFLVAKKIGNDTNFISLTINIKNKFLRCFVVFSTPQSRSFLLISLMRRQRLGALRYFAQRINLSTWLGVILINILTLPFWTGNTFCIPFFIA